jgi:hypothetical protein
MEAKAILCVFFFAGVVLGSNVAAYVPAHIDFSSAEEDFFALTSFLQDSKKLGEDLLYSSYAANVSFIFSDEIKLNFNARHRNQSLVLADDLLQNLNFSLLVLDGVDDLVQSKQILNDILLPLREIGLSVSSLCRLHFDVIEGFDRLYIHILSNSTGEGGGLHNFTLIHQNLEEMNNDISTVFEVLPLISEYFSIDYFEQMLEQFSLLIAQYEEYLSRLLSFLVIDEPKLVLYANKNTCYISNYIVFSGFFIQPSGVISNYSISLIQDDVLRNSSQTNEFGRFSFSVDTKMMHPHQYSYVAETTFQGFDYVSDTVLVDVVLMPTKISIEQSKRHIQPNESFMIHGRLLTIFNQPLEADVAIKSLNSSVKLQTDSKGFFSCTFSNFSKYGSYEITAFFADTSMYRSSFSNATVFVNEPTSLFLYTHSKQFKVNDSLYLFGYLLDTSSHVGIGGKSISLFVNGVKVSQTITDDQGNYSFVYSTVNSSADVLVVQTRFFGGTHWRPAASNGIEVGVFVSFFHEYFLIFLLSGIVGIGVFVFLYFFRKHNDKLICIKNQNKKRYNEKNKKPVAMHGTGNTMIQTEDSLSLSNKNKIVSIYHQLLFFFISYGLDIDDSFTHRDIQRKLESFHLPSPLVTDVTACFERAHYSLQPIRKNDVQRFSRNVKSLQSLFLEGLQK